jgi:hypothetical protein
MKHDFIEYNTLKKKINVELKKQDEQLKMEETYTHFPYT